MTNLRSIENAESIVFLVPPGVGSHLAIAIGLVAARSGSKVHFTNDATLIERLVNADKKDKLEETIKGLSKLQLLIVYEIGYLPFTVDSAHALIPADIFTSNKSYDDVGEIFSNLVILAIASAVLDRTLHHCTAVNIKGDCFEPKECTEHLIPQNR